MVAGGFFQQIVSRGQRIEPRRRIVPDHGVIRVEVIPRVQLEPGVALGIDADEVNAVRRHGQGDLLKLAAVVSCEQ